MAHVTTTTGGGYDCETCHGTTPATQVTHGNGTVELTGAAAGYDGDLVVVGGTDHTGTCATNSCHNRGDGVTSPVSGTYNWGTAIGGVGTCTE